MPEHSFGADIVTVEPRQTVVLAGYPNEEQSEWHVNKAVQIGGGPTGPTTAVVLQAIDASEHWVVAIVNKESNGWEVDTLSAFEGEKPQGLDAGEHGTDLDPAAIEVVEIRD